jgi:SAM-dependent methyltransferase
MENFNREEHWNKIYTTKQLNEVSWYQSVPETSLDFIKQSNLALDSKIIDIGGGDGFLVDYLLSAGYTDVTVLDISEFAIEKAKKRLGKDAEKVTWIVCDIIKFKPIEKYDLWHDRAAFHFLTTEKEITDYVGIAQSSINAAGFMVIGTFSDQGPKKCSGIEIKQYTEITLMEKLKLFFEKVKCITVDHKTPFETIQNFIFCSFKRNQLA